MRTEIDHEGGDVPPEWPEDSRTHNRRFRRRQETLTRKSGIRIASLNMNGFGCTTRDHPDNKWGQLYQAMRDLRIGVLILQETHLTVDRVNFIEKMYKGKIKILHSSHPDRPTQKEGVAVVINKRLVQATGVEMTEVVPGRAIQVSVPWDGAVKLRVLGIYAPTSDGESVRREFFQQVEHFYNTPPRLPKADIMAGDFNNVEDAVDRLPVGGLGDTSVSTLDALKQTLGLMMVDGWREAFPTEWAYTFFRGAGQAAQMSRLDRVYVTRRILEDCREWKIHECGVKTDHSMVSVEITHREAPEIGKGRPVFPVGLLKDRKLARKMHDRGIKAAGEVAAIAHDGARTEQRNAQLVLASLKRDWMLMARERERETVPKLLAEIREREAALERMRRNEHVSDEVRRSESAALTSQIRSLRIAQLRVQKKYARAKHWVEGEHPTKYCVRVNKEVKPRDTFKCLEKPGERRPDGGPVYEYKTEWMCEIAKSHHMNLQGDGSDDLESCERVRATEEALAAIKKKLTNEQADDMGKDILYDECERALRFSKNDSAPGIDGIPYEVWKTLEARFVEDSRYEDREAFNVVMVLTAAFLDVQKFGIVEEAGFNVGWMCPIYKGKGERPKIANYRPITLLNTDYKLMTKALAVRL
ncbi:Endonuclease/exonuclease/phosphatase, partial [Daedaleopsis nitida]